MYFMLSLPPHCNAPLPCGADDGGSFLIFVTSGPLSLCCLAETKLRQDQEKRINEPGNAESMLYPSAHGHLRTGGEQTYRYYIAINGAQEENTTCGALNKNYRKAIILTLKDYREKSIILIKYKLPLKSNPFMIEQIHLCSFICWLSSSVHHNPGF